MKRLTPSDVVRAINQLPKNRSYNYINPATRSKLEILRVDEPEGPIVIRRYNPSKGESPLAVKEQSISAAMIRRFAYAVKQDVPLNMDRILGGSYNVRSALEALLAHTPEFYYCYPGRIEVSESSTEIKEGHKHLIWIPNKPHAPNRIEKRAVSNMVISEIPTSEAIYEAIVLPDQKTSELLNLPAEVRRRHAQIQVALVEIGRHLNFRTWVAQNDRTIEYKGKKLGEMTGVIPRLTDERVLKGYEDAVQAARLIDCIWFRNSQFMPAVIEIEHSTGVVSGLSRMKNFQDKGPQLKQVRWVVAAPDELRDKVLREGSKPQFRSLGAQFFPYSAIDELYSLCQRRRIRGVNDEFLDCFMERCAPVLQ